MVDMNKINYDKQMQKAMASIPRGTKLLLHVCCAPCTTYCLTRLVEHFDVTLYYSNDNITDKHEWQKRLDEVSKLVDIVNDNKFEVAPKFAVKLLVKSHDANKFLSWASNKSDEKEGGSRCKDCYVMRLSDTHAQATEMGFDYFATTLTVSPYKNAEWINQIGYSLATDDGARWLPTDFKKNDGYKTSVGLSNKYGLYRQHYCGCEYSKLENDLR